jgi:hypothetical protein
MKRTACADRQGISSIERADTEHATAKGQPCRTMLLGDGRSEEHWPLPKFALFASNLIELRTLVLSLLDDPEVVHKILSKLDLLIPEATKDYETIAETAARYRLSTRTIRRAMARGLPYERPVGRRVRIPLAKARAWFESGKGRELEKHR